MDVHTDFTELFLSLPDIVALPASCQEHGENMPRAQKPFDRASRHKKGANCATYAMMKPQKMTMDMYALPDPCGRLPNAKMKQVSRVKR